MRARKPKSKGVLTPAQREILRAFQRLPDADRFYLTGGTALAEFYLGHRRSFDLDLFTTEQGLIRPFSRVLEDRFREEGFTLEVVRRLETFAEFVIHCKGEAVRVQVAYDSPYRFGPPEETPLILVNDYQDLVVDKLLAFFGRAEPRDAVDLFFILRDEDLEELVKLAKKKAPGFDLYWLARAFENTGLRGPLKRLMTSPMNWTDGRSRW